MCREPMSGDTLVVEARTERLASVRSFVRQRGTELGLIGSDLDDLVLATDEAVTNVILHGYRGEPGQVEISVGAENDGVVVVVRDDAPVFDPSSVRLPSGGPDSVTHDGGGRGIYFIHALLDRIAHRPLAGGGNELRLSKSGRRRSST